MPAIDAVVFDLDGVLIDSEGAWDEVRRSLAERAGRAWPADATGAMQGMSTREWSTYLTGTVGVPGTPTEVAAGVIEAMTERYADDLPLLPGATDAVSRLAARWPLGLASSSPRRLIDAVLAAADLTGHFQVTLSTEEVERGKPSPAVYLEAVRRLAVAPGRAVAVEDSSNGLRAASAAGLGVVALPTADFPPSPDALGLARLVVAGLSELTVERLEQTFSAP